MELQKDMLLLLPALDDEKLTSEYIEVTGTTVAPSNGEIKTLDEMEKDAILTALEKHNFNQSSAANELGITLRQIGYKMKKYGI